MCHTRSKAFFKSVKLCWSSRWCKFFYEQAIVDYLLNCAGLSLFKRTLSITLLQCLYPAFSLPSPCLQLAFTLPSSRFHLALTPPSSNLPPAFIPPCLNPAFTSPSVRHHPAFTPTSSSIHPDFSLTSPRFHRAVFPAFIPPSPRLDPTVFPP
jgi:hypothetical protein